MNTRLLCASASAAAAAATGLFTTTARCETYTGVWEGRTDKKLGKDAEMSRAAHATTNVSAKNYCIWSERVNGVARELFLLIGGLDPYVREHTAPETKAMRALREKMENSDFEGEFKAGRTMFKYGSELSTDIVEANMLKAFVRMAKPKRVLEIGMFVGYAAAAMAEALPADGVVVSLEIDPWLRDFVGDELNKFDDLRGKHTVVVGPALDSLRRMPVGRDQFDMVFVDAVKLEYKDYVETILERDLLAPGGTIVVDNTLYCAVPYMSEDYDTQPARRSHGNAVQEFNKWVQDHPNLEQTILPIRDGVTLIHVV